nr:uncharacterized protein LOC128685282 [Cherax quadricarinatus]
MHVPLATLAGHAYPSGHTRGHACPSGHAGGTCMSLWPRWRDMHVPLATLGDMHVPLATLAGHASLKSCICGHTGTAAEYGRECLAWPPQPPPLRTSDLQEVDDYFTYLKTPQARCRKVVIMGGHHTCGDVTDDLVDGSKVVCMDPPLGLLPIRDPTTCLTLSFGIHFDSTFDVAVSKFNCEVHMFDLLDYSPTELLNTSTHAYFHQVSRLLFLSHKSLNKTSSP